MKKITKFYTPMQKKSAMKLLLLLFFIGYSSASTYDALDDAAEKLVASFMEGMERAPPLHLALGVEKSEVIKRAEQEVKDDIAQKLRDALNAILERIKTTLEKGRSIRDETLEKLKELRQKMKEAKIDMGNRAKELLEIIKEKTKEFIQNLLNKLGSKYDITDEAEIALADVNLRELLKELKKELLSKIDADVLKDRIKKILGQTSELLDQFLTVLRKKGKQKLIDLIDRILDIDDDDDRPSRSVKNVWDKVKNYFKDLNIELKEKFSKFGEWVKETMRKGLDNTRDKMDNIKDIAKELIANSKTLSKEIATQALEFLRPYKDDLGTLWEQVQQALKGVLNRKD